MIEVTVSLLLGLLPVRAWAVKLEYGRLLEDRRPAR